MKSSEPLVSALQARSRWSGEWSASWRSKNAAPFASASPSRRSLGLPAVARLAADERVLAALAVAGRVGEGAVDLRHGPVVLLDAAAHFGDDLLAQRRRAGEHRLRKRVLGLEVGPDPRRQDGRVPEHVHPVGGLEPGEIVAQPHAVDFELARLGKDRRLGRWQLQAIALHRRVSGLGTGGWVRMWGYGAAAQVGQAPAILRPSQPSFAWFCRRVAGNRGEIPNVREFSTCVLSPADLIETTIRASSPSSTPAPASTSLESKISLQRATGVRALDSAAKVHRTSKESTQ